MVTVHRPWSVWALADLRSVPVTVASSSRYFWPSPSQATIWASAWVIARAGRARRASQLTEGTYSWMCSGNTATSAGDSAAIACSTSGVSACPSWSELTSLAAAYAGPSLAATAACGPRDVEPLAGVGVAAGAAGVAVAGPPGAVLGAGVAGAADEAVGAAVGGRPAAPLVEVASTLRIRS